ncbi:MAG: hypothetical protein AUK44_00030 [Porphyromonadaceae bacterium CG2_30_38_12]|nr:MAG: hypothetical protein AUK44_00030 [Porphyromonadaceae bacterium CG2_30_38_12]
MQSDKARQEILDKIRKVNYRAENVHNKTPYANEEIYKPILPDALHCFAAELQAINGESVIAKSEKELFEKLKSLLLQKKIETIYCRDKLIAKQLDKYQISHSHSENEFLTMTCGISNCECLVARTGSVVVSSYGDSGRQMNVYPPIHIVLAQSSQLVNYLSDAYDSLHKKYTEFPSTITTITGPSRTADIEKTLVLGAHGPKELIVFILE